RKKDRSGSWWQSTWKPATSGARTTGGRSGGARTAASSSPVATSASAQAARSHRPVASLNTLFTIGSESSARIPGSTAGTLQSRVLKSPSISQPTSPEAMGTSITPLADRVVVKPEAAEEKTAGGLIIPDTAKEKPQKGTVVAVGPGRVENGTKIDMTVKEGDTVLYGKYAGTEITLDGDEVMIMRESDILGVVKS